MDRDETVSRRASTGVKREYTGLAFALSVYIQLNRENTWTLSGICKLNFILQKNTTEHTGHRLKTP
jgi:hypothetical protein